MNLNNKRVLISGATRGIGKATKELLEQEGCEVIGFGREECDLVSPSQIGRFVPVLKPLDVLINNAGVFLTKPFQDTLSSEWNYVFNANVRGPFLLVRCLLDHNLFKKRAIILNVNSWDILSWPINQIAYNCSKAALKMLTRSLKKELKPQGIYVTDVILPPVQTDMMKQINLKNPMPKVIMSPKEAANLILMELEDPYEAIEEDNELQL